MPTMTNNDLAAYKVRIQSMERIAMNVITSRSALMQGMQADPCRNIDAECGYPTTIDIKLYRQYWEREGLATRVVSVLPTESWRLDPDIYEKEDDEETEFEIAWKKTNEKFNLVSYMERADMLSGIGRYGGLLLGINDGKALDQPAAGYDVKGNPTGAPKAELLFIRALDEALVDISTYDTDITSPRYGQPMLYNIRLSDYSTTTGTGSAGVDLTQRPVHWTRFVHYADNRTSSEVVGMPRMQPVFNYLYNIKKIAGGSTEMFWKGGFPGLSFETFPEMGDAELDTASIKQEIRDYQNGLKRFLALEGGQVKNLGVQVADPTPNERMNIELICITLGVPMRVFMGSEQAKLASDQDSRAWYERLKKRQSKYLSPYVVRPLVDRLQALGILPKVEEYIVKWPDLHTASDIEKAEVMLKRTQALGAYVSQDVSTVIPPRAYLIRLGGMTEDEADAVLKEAMEHVDETMERDIETAKKADAKGLILPDGPQPKPPPPVLAPKAPGKGAPGAKKPAAGAKTAPAVRRPAKRAA